MEVEMELSRILITELGHEQVIFLKEKNGERTFPIVIGISCSASSSESVTVSPRS